jgi:hypothetical protein
MPARWTSEMPMATLNGAVSENFEVRLEASKGLQ